LFGVGEGEAAGLAAVFGGVFEDVFDDDLDFAKAPGARPRQRTPAMRRRRRRGAFIINRGAG